MKKWYLLVAIAALTACSDKAEKQGSVNYAFSPRITEQMQLVNSLLGPCPGDAFCQTELLREGAKIPTFPVSSIDDIVGIYVYDQPSFNPAGLVYEWNCAYSSADKAALRENCLTVERANELLVPYVKK